jgi:hypothetical protein
MIDFNASPSVEDQDSQPITLALDPTAERELYRRRAQGTLHREVLAAEGQTVVAPSAMMTVGVDDVATYSMWVPRAVDCGTFTTDLVSGDCGTFTVDAIHLDCGSF